MKIIEISYEALYKTKDYENERIGFRVQLHEDENEQDIIQELRKKAFKASKKYEHLKTKALATRKDRYSTKSEKRWSEAILEGEFDAEFEEFEDD